MCQIIVWHTFCIYYFERKTRLELATPTLARLCSTNWAISAECEEEETRTPTSQLTLPPQSSASTNSATSPFLLRNSLFQSAPGGGWTISASSSLQVVLLLDCLCKDITISWISQVFYWEIYWNPSFFAFSGGKTNLLAESMQWFIPNWLLDPDQI